jgi:hypothetical protein
MQSSENCVKQQIICKSYYIKKKCSGCSVHASIGSKKGTGIQDFFTKRQFGGLKKQNKKAQG